MRCEIDETHATQLVNLIRHCSVMSAERPQDQGISHVCDVVGSVV